jgi:hypothetical protein
VIVRYRPSSPTRTIASAVLFFAIIHRSCITTCSRRRPYLAMDYDRNNWRNKIDGQSFDDVDFRAHCFVAAGENIRSKKILRGCAQAGFVQVSHLR